MTIETIDPLDPDEPLYADGIACFLCDGCNAVHIGFVDDDDVVIAMATVEPDQIEWLIGRLQECLKETGTRCAAPEGVQ